MIKGGLPPFKKLDKEIIKISKEKTFQPDLLISSLLKNNSSNRLFKKNITKEEIDLNEKINEDETITNNNL